MKPVRTRSVTRPRSNQNQNPMQNLKQLALLGAVLFLIAAIIALYVAWQDLRNSSSGGPVVI